jgi:hypothetical protein
MANPTAARKFVDRPMVKMIAYKRLATGILSFAVGLGGIVYALIKRPPMTSESWLMAAAFLAITLGGGVWTFRDGLRTVKILGTPKP